MPGTEGARLRDGINLSFKTFSPGFRQEPRDIACLPWNATDADGVIRRGWKAL